MWDFLQDRKNLLQESLLDKPYPNVNYEAIWASPIFLSYQVVLWLYVNETRTMQM